VIGLAAKAGYDPEIQAGSARNRRLMTMKRKFAAPLAILTVLAIVVCGISTSVEAGKKSDTPVTTTIDGLGVNTTPTLRIQSDLLGSYANSSSLKSILQSSLGDWEFDVLNVNSSPQRKVLIDLRDSIPGSGPNGGAPTPPFAYALVRTRFLAQCAVAGVDMRTMPVNVPVYCPLIIAINDLNGVRYRLTMNPPNFSETQYAKVTCLSAASGKCTQWKLEPSVTQLDGEVKNVAKLLKVATKNNQPDLNMGNFYMSFSIHLTNP
jgi:hypothetical protein